MDSCPFCALVSSAKFVWSSPLSVAFADGFPVGPGHTLVIPRRHQADLFELSSEERSDLWQLVAEVKESLEGDLNPDGYNVGVNIGPAAGQTVAHAHIHLIPRFSGDAADPRGGVRWVLPEHAAYWETR